MRLAFSLQARTARPVRDPDCGAARARQDDKPPAGKGAAAPPGAGAEDKDKPYQDWKKVTKDSEMKKGFFTLYSKRENLYLEIRPDQLDKPVLGIFSLAQGIGQSGVIGGLPVERPAARVPPRRRPRAGDGREHPLHRAGRLAARARRWICRWAAR